MALTTCNECKAQMSTAAGACPQCGAPPAKRTSIVTWLVLGLMLVVGYQMVASPSINDSKPALSEAQLAVKARGDREINLVIAGARMLKQSMKKPETFELVSATMIGDDTICYQYKARNSWNDVTNGHYVLSNAVSSADATAWNKLCAGKSGTDYSYASASI